MISSATWHSSIVEMNYGMSLDCVIIILNQMFKEQIISKSGFVHGQWHRGAF